MTYKARILKNGDYDLLSTEDDMDDPASDGQCEVSTGIPDLNLILRKMMLQLIKSTTSGPPQCAISFGPIEKTEDHLRALQAAAYPPHPQIQLLPGGGFAVVPHPVDLNIELTADEIPLLGNCLELLGYDVQWNADHSSWDTDAPREIAYEQLRKIREQKAA